MRIKIDKGVAKGKITAPPSKSMAHRLLISAAMASGVSTVRGISDCEDVAATIDCLRALGIKADRIGSDVRVEGKSFREVQPVTPLECRESGSTLRFMIPTAMLSAMKKNKKKQTPLLFCFVLT